MAVLAGWVGLAAAPPEVLVQAPSSLREGDAESLSVRATDLVALDLARLGAAVWPRPAGPSDAPPATVASLWVTVRTDGRGIALLARAGSHTATTAGTVAALDAATTRLALALAPRLGLPVPEGARAHLAASDPTPELVQRVLGQAALDLAIGQWARARLRFGRAEEIWRGTQQPAALDGAWAAIVRGARASSEVASAADPLARSALEAAQMAARDRAPEKAVTSAAAALRYWTDRALAWAAPLDPSVQVTAGDDEWWLSGERGERALDPRTGARRRELHGPGRWLGMVGEDVLRLEGAALSRLTPQGVVRWRRALPWRSAAVELGALAGGFALARAEGERGLAWIDASTGGIAQADPGATALAVGVDGALVRLASGELALLRPGRRAPAWTVPGVDGAVMMVPGRALVLAGDGVRVLDGSNGKARGGVIAVGEGARWLGADGRYAIAAAPREAVVIDALAAQVSARVNGPGAPTAAASHDSGVAVAFEGGDVLLVDRDGVVADRARVTGRPLAVFPGRPSAPGFLVRTDRGVFALGPVPSRDHGRDVDVALTLAELCRATGDRRGALRLAERVALEGAGRVAEAEALRALLLGEEQGATAAAAAAAGRRSRAARDVAQTLPPFALR